METNAETNPESNATPTEPANALENNAPPAPTASQKARSQRRQKAVIDRIEDGKYAVLLVGSRQVEKSIPVEQLPEGARAGSWLKVRVTDDSVKDILVDEEETQAARARVQTKLDMLRNRPGYFTPVTSADTQNGSIQPLNSMPSESQESEWKSGSEQK